MRGEGDACLPLQLGAILRNAEGGSPVAVGWEAKGVLKASQCPTTSHACGPGLAVPRGRGTPFQFTQNTICQPGCWFVGGHPPGGGAFCWFTQGRIGAAGPWPLESHLPKVKEMKYFSSKTTPGCLSQRHLIGHEGTRMKLPQLQSLEGWDFGGHLGVYPWGNG